PADAVVVGDVAGPAGSRKTSWNRSAAADPPFVNRRPLLSLPFLPAVPGYPPSRHPILPASAALTSLLMEQARAREEQACSCCCAARCLPPRLVSRRISSATPLGSTEPLRASRWPRDRATSIPKAGPLLARGD